MFGSDQELIANSYSSCCSSCWDDLVKKIKAPLFQIEFGWNLVGILFKQIWID